MEVLKIKDQLEKLMTQLSYSDPDISILEVKEELVKTFSEVFSVIVLSQKDLNQ
jgi:hypothetical protein